MLRNSLIGTHFFEMLNNEKMTISCSGLDSRATTIQFRRYAVHISIGRQRSLYYFDMTTGLERRATTIQLSRCRVHISVGPAVSLLL